MGAILFEMLTGRRFNPASTLDEALAFRVDEVPSVRAFNQDIPGRLDEICARLLAADPDERYHSVRELLIDIGVLRQEASLEELEALYGDPFFRKLQEGPFPDRSKRKGEEGGEGCLP